MQMTLKHFWNILATVYFISAPHVRTALPPVDHFILIIHQHFYQKLSMSHYYIVLRLSISQSTGLF